MPHCKYGYYVTLLPCKQFHLGATGPQLSHGGHDWPPLRTASGPTGRLDVTYIQQFTGLRPGRRPIALHSLSTVYYVALLRGPHYALPPPSVCLSVCPSVPCLRFYRNRKALQTSNL